MFTVQELEAHGIRGRSASANLFRLRPDLESPMRPYTVMDIPSEEVTQLVVVTARHFVPHTSHPQVHVCTVQLRMLYCRQIFVE